MDKDIARNIDVWEHTLEISQLYDYEPAIPLNISQDYSEIDSKISSKILIIHANPLEAACEVAKQKVCPLVVNAGDSSDPIKKVEAGAISDECDLYRRTNIGCPTRDDIYPLKGRALLFPKITVFKSETFSMIEKPFIISVLSLAPVSNPAVMGIKTESIVKNEYQSVDDYNKMRNSINFMFQTAIDRNYECIIVNDFGCRSNLGNPIDIVVDMFNDAIKKYPVPLIIFCIERSHEDRHSSKEYYNHVYFHDNIHR